MEANEILDALGDAIDEWRSALDDADACIRMSTDEETLAGHEEWRDTVAGALLGLRTFRGVINEQMGE